jgi:hypothetical protein
MRSHVLDLNYDYGLRLAQEGFVTFSIDWMGFGERSEGHKPNSFSVRNSLGYRLTPWT